jgi:hypothetical protein
MPKKNARSVSNAGTAIGKALSPRELHVLMTALNEYALSAPPDLQSAVKTAGAKLRQANAAKAKSAA